jgi:hypothetical protein
MDKMLKLPKYIRLTFCFNLYFLGADREWHLAQKNMEAAGASLSTVTNDLCLVSMKSKSTSGHCFASIEG